MGTENRVLPEHLMMASELEKSVRNVYRTDNFYINKWSKPIETATKLLMLNFTIYIKSKIAEI